MRRPFGAVAGGVADDPRQPPEQAGHHDRARAAEFGDGLARRASTVPTLRNLSAQVLTGTPTTLCRLAEHLLATGQRPAAVELALFGGEALFAGQRRLLAAAFPGAEARSAGYASVDAGLLGRPAAGPDAYALLGAAEDPQVPRPRAGSPAGGARRTGQGVGAGGGREPAVPPGGRRIGQRRLGRRKRADVRPMPPSGAARGLRARARAGGRRPGGGRSSFTARPRPHHHGRCTSSLTVLVVLVVLVVVPGRRMPPGGRRQAVGAGAGLCPSPPRPDPPPRAVSMPGVARRVLPGLVLPGGGPASGCRSSPGVTLLRR